MNNYLIKEGDNMEIDDLEDYEDYEMDKNNLKKTLELNNTSLLKNIDIHLIGLYNYFLNQWNINIYDTNPTIIHISITNNKNIILNKTNNFIFKNNNNIIFTPIDNIIIPALVQKAQIINNDCHLNIQFIDVPLLQDIWFFFNNDNDLSLITLINSKPEIWSNNNLIGTCDIIWPCITSFPIDFKDDILNNIINYSSNKKLLRYFKIKHTHNIKSLINIRIVFKNMNKAYVLCNVVPIVNLFSIQCTPYKYQERMAIYLPNAQYQVWKINDVLYQKDNFKNTIPHLKENQDEYWYYNNNELFVNIKEKNSIIIPKFLCVNKKCVINNNIELIGLNIKNITKITIIDYIQTTNIPLKKFEIINRGINLINSTNIIEKINHGILFSNGCFLPINNWSIIKKDRIIFKGTRYIIESFDQFLVTETSLLFFLCKKIIGDLIDIKNN